MNNYEFINNTDRHRYELHLDDNVMALAEYRITPEGHVALTHTEVPREYRGRGIGGILAEKVLSDIAAQGRKVVPLCSFMVSYITDTPKWHSLRA